MSSKNLKFFCPRQKWEAIGVGNKVVFNRKHYHIQSLEWDVPGDGFYHETVYLKLQHHKTRKIITVKNGNATLV